MAVDQRSPLQVDVFVRSLPTCSLSLTMCRTVSDTVADRTAPRPQYGLIGLVTALSASLTDGTNKERTLTVNSINVFKN